jgi:ABC-2 type transport system ATP-binding protein
MPPCIQLTRLTKHFGSVAAVKELSLEVKSGEVLGLLGPNGAGKSTTLHMITGLVRPTRGSVAVFGKELRKHYLEIAGRMGVMLERPAFYDYLTARENLLIFARLAHRAVTVDRVLAQVGLLEAASLKVRTFSEGMRRRLGLAQALLTEPELLILDEPTAGLDVEGTLDTLALLRRLAAEARVTILFSSHMLHEVEVLCNRVAILNKGELIACEATNALLAYDQSEVEVLVESPQAVARRLGSETWVASVDVRPGSVGVALKDANVHHLAAFLVSAGYKIAGIIPRRRTLQDYFLEVLKK